MTHERWDDVVAPYVLGALPEDERADFERHLEECEVCRAEAELLRVPAEALPAAAPQFVPPPELRDRIMLIVNREAELLAAAGPEADRPPVAARERRRFSWLRPSVAIPVVLACGVLLGIVTTGALREDVRTVTAAQAPAGSSVTLEVGEEHSRMVADDLPEPPPGRIYQVWLKLEGRAAPVPTDALFTVREGGDASVDVPGELDDVEAVLVTHEPLGGSQTPTVDPIIRVVPA